MKKCLALMFACAFVGSLVSAQSGPWLAYTYKASIKRLDNQIGTVKYSLGAFDQSANTEAILDSYTTAKDSLSGYLLVPVCIGCAEGGSESSQPFGTSFLYVMRKGDKQDNIWKFETEVSAALFNKGVGIRGEDEEELAAFPTSLKKLTQAGMGFTFVFEDMGLTNDTKYGEVPYGFLGNGSSEGVITQTGFGKAKSLSETTVDFCQGTTTIRCHVVTSISGGMTGFVVQQGVCTEVPMWDVCALTLTPSGVMYGTWSIKLNESFSSDLNDLADFDEVEEAIVEKMDGYLLGGMTSAD